MIWCIRNNLFLNNFVQNYQCIKLFFESLFVVYFKKANDLIISSLYYLQKNANIIQKIVFLKMRINKLHSNKKIYEITNLNVFIVINYFLNQIEFCVLKESIN